MAKKTKTFRKKAVLKAIGKYARRKLNFVTDIFYDNDNKLYIDGQETNSLIIGEILTGNQSEFQILGKQYGFVKLRGIYIEAVAYSTGSRFDTGICIGHANDSLVFNNIRTQPNIMLFDVHTKNKSYVKISSEFTSTNSIELFNNIAILPFTQGTGQARFSLKITLYLTFKTNL